MPTSKTESRALAGAALEVSQMHEQRTATSAPGASLALEPFRERVTLTPRFARRLRTRAEKNGRSASAEASFLLAGVLVPKGAERKRLARRDLADVLGEGASR